MPWFVYIVRCADDSLYTGITNDLERRVEAHSTGKGARYTRSRGPVTLVWSRRKRDKPGALREEYALKQLTRTQKLELIARKPERARRR